jgi:acyl carrier protein
MNLEIFLDQFRSQFEDTDLTTITESSEFKNIKEWDSLIALSIIALIDDEYGVLLTGSDMLRSNTVSDLYTLVESKL